MPLLLILSIICFALASLSVNTGRLNLVALGLVFLVASQLWPRAGSL
jgi:hypothetical protein